jgi:hypothetical protein
MRLQPLARFGFFAAAFGLSACDLGTSSGDGDAARVSFTVPMSFSGTVAAQNRVESGGDIDRIDATIVVKSTGEVVLQRSIRQGDPDLEEVEGAGDHDPAITLRFRIPEGGETETFTLTLKGFLGQTQNYSIGPIDFQLGTDGRSASVSAQAIYIGPGSDVTGVAISPRSISLGVNQTAAFSCVGTPGSVTDFPYEVETVNPGIAAVQSLTSIRGASVGSTELVCRMGFGSRAEDRIPVVVTGGPTISIVSGGNQSVVAGQQLPDPIVVQVRRGDGAFLSGVTVTFTPNAGHGTVIPTSAITNAQGQATTQWTLGSVLGTETLRATTTVDGAPISVEITAQAGAQGGTGSITGTVQSNQGSPISGATVEVRSGPNNTTGAVVANTASGANGAFRFDLLAAGQYTIRASAPGFVDGTTVVTVSAGASVSATIQLVASLTGAIAGKVTNVQTGLPVSGATVQVRSGTGVTTGTPLDTKTTSADGTFDFQNRIAGPYTVRATAPGFAEAFFNVIVVANETANAPLSLSPVQGAGQIRIVLTWGNTLDLDSHLSVPQGGANGTPIVVYWNSPYRLDQGCTLVVNPFACLERDAVPPSNPPTESTLIGTVLSGTYSFFVHNYTADSEDRGSTDNSLSTSGAKVDVYIGASTTAAASFTVPSGPGNLWTVFTMQLSGGSPVFTPVTTNALTNVDFSGPPAETGQGQAGSSVSLKRLKGGPVRQ